MVFMANTESIPDSQNHSQRLDGPAFRIFLSCGAPEQLTQRLQCELKAGVLIRQPDFSVL